VRDRERRAVNLFWWWVDLLSRQVGRDASTDDDWTDDPLLAP
jgi:hypothetical protein